MDICQFLSDPSPIIALPFYSVTLCLWDLTDVTLACEDSRNLSKNCATSYSLTSCCYFWQLLTLEKNENLVVNVGTKQKPWCWCWHKTKDDAEAKQKPCYWCCLMKTKAMLLMLLDENKSHDVDLGTKQKAMLLMLEQNKNRIVHFGTKQTTCC